MIYLFECCERVVEAEFSPNDEKIVDCPECGKQMRRVFTSPMIFSSGMSDYYDDTLGIYVSSKFQREEEMKRQGLTEYSPDPERVAATRERRYIEKHAGGDRASAASEVAKIQKELSKKKRAKQRKRNLEALRPVAQKVVNEVFK